MFHLLPSRPLADPIVTNFRNSLLQYNELNYQTHPLYVKRDALQEADSEIVRGIKVEPKYVLKSVSAPNQRKSISNAATKSKPQTIQTKIQQTPISQPPKSITIAQCRHCRWPFPETMLSEDRDLHTIRCKNGYGEQDQMVWIKCKGNRVDYRRRFEEFLPKRKEKAASNQQKPSKLLVAKKNATMETEEDFETAKIKKKKDIKETYPVVVIEGVTAQTKKRKAPTDVSETKLNQNNPMVREELKKVKKETATPELKPVTIPQPHGTPAQNNPEAFIGKGRKSGQKKIISLPMASGLIFDPTQAFSKFSNEEK